METLTEQNRSMTMTEAIAQVLLSLLDIAENAVSSLPWDIAGTHPVQHKVDDGLPETKVTKAEAKRTLTRYVTNAIESGFSPCSQMPTSPSLDGIRRVLGETYTIKSGKNAGVKVATLAYALYRIQAAEARAAKSAKRMKALADAQADGGCWFAAGVQDKEGVGFPYPTEDKARKAWARQHVSTDEAEWHEVSTPTSTKADDKEARAAILTEAEVTQGTYVSVATKADETVEVINTSVATTGDEAIIHAAQGLGSKATTVAGARKFLANLS